MKLLEYEAKAILQKGSVALPSSYIAGEEPQFLPVVLKSQVPVGGRGKAGGIITVNTAGEYKEARRKLLSLPIKDFVPKTILAEEVIAIAAEFYLLLAVDKSSASVELVASRHGGIDVEQNDGDDFLKVQLDGKNADDVGQRLADYYDLADKTFLLQDLVQHLSALFARQDMTMLEINPLILTKSGQLIAADCKMVLDDAAYFRHPEWAFENEKTETNFVTLDEKGVVATIANGAGLAMATVDAASDAGLSPANFLDIGGGANEASVLAAFQRITEYPAVKVIIINIFAGITRCDEVAKAIVAARSQITTLPPLAIRLAGTNYEQAAALLEKEGIGMYANLDEAIKAAKAAI